MCISPPPHNTMHPCCRFAKKRNLSNLIEN
nr:MAG TPA: hypothetical protein [Bacteriophage sp.]